MMSPLVMLKRSSVVINHRKPYGQKKRRPDYPGAVGCTSSRPLDLAAGLGHWGGGFLAGHRRPDGEHVVGIALGRMRLACEHRAHQLMVAGAIFRRTRLQ